MTFNVAIQEVIRDDGRREAGRRVGCCQSIIQAVDSNVQASKLENLYQQVSHHGS